jgi:hypothetical protein
VSARTVAALAVLLAAVLLMHVRLSASVTLPAWQLAVVIEVAAAVVIGRAIVREARTGFRSSPAWRALHPRPAPEPAFPW